MDHSKLKGVEMANELARSGKFIFAIKHLELVNPNIKRAEAKAIVDGFGYGVRTRPKPADSEER